MTDVRGTLIDVFAKRRCSEVESATNYLVNAFGVKDYEAVTALPAYEEEYNRVREAKLKIERIESRFPAPPGDQALQCLSLLKDLRLDTVYPSNEYQATRALIMKTLYAKWPPPDQQRFDARVAIFDTWADVFISYTNRDATATNNRYRNLITHHLGWPRKAEVESLNYVARVLAKFLERKSIRGFMDYKNLKCGDDISAKILDHCRTTIAFIQLVEEAVLTEPEPPTVNWCYREYSEFAAAALPVVTPPGFGNRRFFILGGMRNLAAPAGMGKPYGNWFAQMGTLHIVLDNCNTKPFDELNSKVDEIARQIVEVRKQLVESMLATWS